RKDAEPGHGESQNASAICPWSSAPVREKDNGRIDLSNAGESRSSSARRFPREPQPCPVAVPSYTFLRRRQEKAMNTKQTQPAVAPYDDARTVGHYIGGKPVEGVGARSPVYNPATGAVARHVVLATSSDVDRAVKAAREAFPAWADTPPIRRARVLNRFLDLMNRHADEIAARITAEHGKTFEDACGEVARGIDIVEFACGAPQLLKGDFTGQVSSGMDNWTTREALGVVAGITPFNFPAMVPCWMFPVAIACGNAFVLKPSERDPSASVHIAHLLREAGLPDGVFNVVQGDKTAVDALLHHPDVAAVSFVGSTPIARYIYETGARRGIRVQALGGAKNHMVVLPDADVDQAVD